MARRERDAYYTPALATQVLLARVPELRGHALLDPCCGDGRMAEAMARRFSVVYLNDLNPAAPADIHEDAADPRLYAAYQPDWVVTNPPFNAAAPIAALALEHARVGVALLLRCTWLEPVKSRRALLTSTPPTRVLALDRISFTGAGVDSAPCWWLIWLRDESGAWMRGSIEIVALGDEGQEVLL